MAVWHAAMRATTSLSRLSTVGVGAPIEAPAAEAPARFAAGLTSRLDVAQAESNLADTKAVIPQLEQRLGFGYNRLAVLLGVTPGALNDEQHKSTKKRV